MYIATIAKKPFCVVNKITMVIPHVITNYCEREYYNLKVLASWKVNCIFDISSTWHTSGFNILIINYAVWDFICGKISVTLSQNIFYFA